MTEGQTAGGSRTATGWAYPADDPRLQPPTLRADALDRSRLLRRIQESGHARIVAVIAPAGFGKTTLLAQWKASEARSVAWVTVDASCTDPTVVLGLVAAAVDAATGSDVRADLVADTTETSLFATAVPRLATAIHRIERPPIVILDDLHAIEESAGLDAIATLIGYLSASTMVGFASRTTTGLPMARWRASGLTIELDEDDLAFEADESVELVRRVEPGLGGDRALALHDRTEGWPAAMYLAARAAGSAGSPADGASPSATPDEANGPNVPGQAIDDYLHAELFERFDSTTRRFLLEAAILDRLTGPLCDAVTGSTDSGERLARLATSHHMIAPLDTRGWYRLHPLLRGYLLQRLERDGADVASLRRRAAGWLVAHGQPDQAVEQLLGAGDTAAAAAHASDLALHLIRDGRLTTLDRWMTQFRTADLQMNPALTATAAISAILRGEVQRAAILSSVLDRASGGGAADGVSPTSTPGDVVRGLTARDGFDQAFERVLRAGEACDPASPWRPIALAIAAGLALARDDDAEFERLLPIAAAEARQQGAARALAGVIAMQSISAARRDAWVRADALAREAVSLAERTGQTHETTGGLAYGAAARSTAHRGDIATARLYLASLHGASVALTPAAPWLSVTALLEGARAYLAISDPSGARALLRQADGVVVSRPDLGVLSERIHALQARIRALPPGVSGASTLTPAEIRVLRLLPTYLSMPEIADRLVVSANTVRTQVQSIYGKLGASSRAEAIDLAIEAGLLEPLPILAAT